MNTKKVNYFSGLQFLFLKQTEIEGKRKYLQKKTPILKKRVVIYYFFVLRWFCKCVETNILTSLKMFWLRTVHKFYC